MRIETKKIRIEGFFGKTGWDFSISPANSFKSWIAVWHCYGVDCGIAIGKKEVFFRSLGVRRD